MNYEELLREGKIEPVEKKEFDLSLALRDLKAAKDNYQAKDYDWALCIAYNAVLQASRALMFSLGYRTKGKEQHKSVFEFMEKTNLNKELIGYFNVIRKTRHIAVYDQSGMISPQTAEETINKAEQFVHKIRTTVLER